MPEADIQTLFSAGALAAAKNSLSKQWFTGVSDLMDVVEGITRGEDARLLLEALHRRIATLIPGAAIWRLGNKATDDQKRERKTVIDNENPELREFATLVNIYKQNIPGWGGKSPIDLVYGEPTPAMVNMVTGEPVPAENTWLMAIFPFQQSTFKNDKVLNELVALEGAGLPREIPRVIGGSQPASPFKLPGQEEKQMREGVLLSNQERQRLGVLLTKESDDSGDTLHEAMKALMDTDEYQDASDGRYGGKATLMAQTFNGFLDRAEEQLREEYPRVDQVIVRRQLERGLGKLPKSMDDMKDAMREMVR